MQKLNLKTTAEKLVKGNIKVINSIKKNIVSTPELLDGFVKLQTSTLNLLYFIQTENDIEKGSINNTDAGSLHTDQKNK